MPDSRSHRGAHPRDEHDFRESELPKLRQAVAEFSWLSTRGYPVRRSAELVGDRHTLRERQRKAVGRVAAADQDVQRRTERRIEPADLRGLRVEVDGYNVLLTVEAAFGGGVVLPARDHTLRDLAAMSRHYKKVEETRRALDRIGIYLQRHGVAEVCWLFDQPISNSGRLRAMMLELSAEKGFPWEVHLVPNPDPVLQKSEHVVATADSGILDAEGIRWLNLAREVVEASVPDAWRVDLVDP